MEAMQQSIRHTECTKKSKEQFSMQSQINSISCTTSLCQYLL